MTKPKTAAEKKQARSRKRVAAVKERSQQKDTVAADATIDKLKKEMGAEVVEEKASEAIVPRPKALRFATASAFVKRVREWEASMQIAPPEVEEDLVKEHEEALQARREELAAQRKEEEAKMPQAAEKAAETPKGRKVKIEGSEDLAKQFDEILAHVRKAEKGPKAQRETEAYEARKMISTAWYFADRLLKATREANAA